MRRLAETGYGPAFVDTDKLLSERGLFESHQRFLALLVDGAWRRRFGGGGQSHGLTIER